MGMRKDFQLKGAGEGMLKGAKSSHEEPSQAPLSTLICMRNLFNFYAKTSISSDLAKRIFRVLFPFPSLSGKHQHVAGETIAPTLSANI